MLARWVPGTLTDDQKRTRLDVSRYLLSRHEDDPGDFIERVVTQGSTKCIANNGSTLVRPLLRNLRGLIQQGM